MGLLSLGTPIPWEESRNLSEHVRDNGVEQLINIFNAAAKRDGDVYYWGDEVEYMLVSFDDANKTARLSVDKDSILDDLNAGGVAFKDALDNNLNFHPEYGRFMIEATPLKPYNGADLNEYLYVEKNMHLRRVVATKSLQNNKIKPMTITAFPLMGRGDFTEPALPAHSKASCSMFLPDEITNRHYRFPTLTRNIRTRRGEKVAINVPMYKDTNTLPVDDSIPQRALFENDREAALGAALPGHIYMDAMGFGMGCSCLQITVQAPNINRARFLYDALVNLCGPLLAVSAAAPIFKGFLADQDVRWNVISGAVDDRTPFERGVDSLYPEKDNYGGIRPEDREKTQRLPKSRYSVVDNYLGDKQTDGFRYFKPEFNDTAAPVNEKVFNKLMANENFDSVIANHFAHLYVRDPLVIYRERVDQDNAAENDHFENIQSTNWQSLRFKPPTQQATPDNKDVPGWRVEFRPLEAQFTDFENAAFSTFIALLAQALLSLDVNPYLPMSLVEKNLETAHATDAVLKSKFFFVDNLLSGEYGYGEYTADEIVNGHSGFIGLIAIVKQHLINKYDMDVSTRSTPLHERFYWYLELLSQRASGKIPTAANWIRSFVTNHELYNHDSKVPETLNWELLSKIQLISDYEDEQLLKQFFGEELGRYLKTVKIQELL